MQDGSITQWSKLGWRQENLSDAWSEARKGNLVLKTTPLPVLLWSVLWTKPRCQGLDVFLEQPSAYQNVNREYDCHGLRLFRHVVGGAAIEERQANPADKSIWQVHSIETNATDRCTALCTALLDFSSTQKEKEWRGNDGKPWLRGLLVQGIALLRILAMMSQWTEVMACLQWEDFHWYWNQKRAEIWAFCIHASSRSWSEQNPSAIWLDVMRESSFVSDCQNDWKAFGRADVPHIQENMPMSMQDTRQCTNV